MEEEAVNFVEIKAGNQREFDKLFRSYYRYLITIAYGYTKDYGLSKDLAQEVFLDIWKRRERIEIKTSLRAFLKRAVINQAITANKKNKHNSELVEGTLQIQSSDNAQGDIELNELNLKIQSIVEMMPNRCREIFMMSRYENLSHKEIAAKLDISLKTIENQITKALKLLRSGLKKEHFISWIIVLLLYS